METGTHEELLATNGLYAELFASGTQIDFQLAGLGSHEDILAKLGTSDMLEIELRKLASWINVRRTGDKQAGLHMLAIRPPGLNADIAPGWLLETAGRHSRFEFQRRQIAAQQVKN